MNQLNTSRSEKRKTIIYAFVVFLCLINIFLFINFTISGILDSDNASELILGKLLSQENSLISKNWYYSTELRFISTNVFYALFFKFTNNWHFVRMLSLLSMYLILLLVYLIWGRAIRAKNTWILFGAILFVPFSKVYYLYVLAGAYYLPNIINIFLIMMLEEFFLTVDSKKKPSFLILAVVISLCSGIGGARQVFMLYIPLFIAGAMSYYRGSNKKINEPLLFSAACLIASVIGYLVNSKILSKYYSFFQYDQISFAPLSFDRIINAINGFINSFGYSSGNIFSMALIKNFICAMWVIVTAVALIFGVKNRDKVSDSYNRVAVFTASMYAIYILLFAFTTMTYVDRYNLPIIIMSIPLVAMFLEQVPFEYNIKKNITIGLIVLTFISGMSFMIENRNVDGNTEKREITQFLLNKGYYNGYSTFWNSNILTELSNGKIEVWDWGDSGDTDFFKNLNDIDQTNKWLQLKSHDNTHPKGKIFLLFKPDEFEECIWREYFNEDHVIYRSDNYVIVAYDNYDQMIDQLYGHYSYRYSFEDNSFFNKGRNVDGKRELYPSGESYGPYLTLPPGKYNVNIKGEKLDDAKVKLTGDYGKKLFIINNMVQNDSSIQYVFTVGKKCNGIETIIENPSNRTIELDSIEIERTY